MPPFGFNDMPAAPANRGHYDGVGSHLKQISIPDKTPTFISAEYLQQVSKTHSLSMLLQEYSSEEFRSLFSGCELHSPWTCEWYAGCEKVLYGLHQCPPYHLYYFRATRNPHLAGISRSPAQSLDAPTIPAAPAVALAKCCVGVMRYQCPVLGILPAKT